ncbi:recombination regulator RecX [bacterium]|nr:recombination regulator RecX [bacterium]
MHKVIKIEHKNKEHLVSIILDSGSRLNLDASLAVQAGLCEGGALSKEQVTDLELQEGKRRVKDKAYQLLAARAHSGQELKKKLTQRGFQPELVDAVLGQLQKDHVVDDSEFARLFARSRLNNKPMGKRRLRCELWQKGLSEEIVDQTLNEVYQERSQAQLARDLVEKRQSRYAHLEGALRKKRLGDLLLRRGFDWSLIKEVIDEIQRQQDTPTRPAAKE